MLGDCYAAAVVQSLSKTELEMMDANDKVARTKDTEETEALMTPVTEEAQTMSEDVSYQHQQAGIEFLQSLFSLCRL